MREGCRWVVGMEGFGDGRVGGRCIYSKSLFRPLQPFSGCILELTAAIIPHPYRGAFLDIAVNNSLRTQEKLGCLQCYIIE